MKYISVANDQIKCDAITFTSHYRGNTLGLLWTVLISLLSVGFFVFATVFVCYLGIGKLQTVAAVELVIILTITILVSALCCGQIWKSVHEATAATSLLFEHLRRKDR